MPARVVFRVNGDQRRHAETTFVPSRTPVPGHFGATITTVMSYDLLAHFHDVEAVNSPAPPSFISGCTVPHHVGVLFVWRQANHRQPAGSAFLS